MISVKLFLVWRKDVSAAALDVQLRFSSFLDEQKNVALPSPRAIEKPADETSNPRFPSDRLQDERLEPGRAFSRWYKHLFARK